MLWFILFLATSDVQSVTLCLISATTSRYSIRCTYLRGSDAKGCVYILVSGMEGVGNVTGTIERGNSGGVSIKLLDIPDFIELLAFDWEQDNRTGNITIMGATSSLGSCLITGTICLLEI